MVLPILVIHSINTLGLYKSLDGFLFSDSPYGVGILITQLSFHRESSQFPMRITSHGDQFDRTRVLKQLYINVYMYS